MIGCQFDSSWSRKLESSFGISVITRSFPLRNRHFPVEVSCVENCKKIWRKKLKNWTLNRQHKICRYSFYRPGWEWHCENKVCQPKALPNIPRPLNLEFSIVTHFWWYVYWKYLVLSHCSRIVRFPRCFQSTFQHVDCSFWILLSG